MQPPDPDETSLERVNGDSAHDDNTASQRSSSRTIVEDYRPNPLTHNLIGSDTTSVTVPSGRGAVGGQEW